MTKGLASRKWADQIEEFSRRHGAEGPRWAVMLTYDCSASAVGRHVIPLLHRRGKAFKTVILADAGCLQQKLPTEGFPHLQCNIYQVRLRGGGVFHPKLLFLRAGHQCLVGFGSANLTSAGLGQNFELWGTTSDVEIVSATVAFLRQLSGDERVLLSENVSALVREATAGLVGAPSPRFWSSFDGPFHRRAKEELDTSLQRVTVVTPAFANATSMRQVLAPWASVPVEVFTDDKRDLKKARVRIFDPFADRRTATDEDDSERAGANRLHAKAYVFERRASSSIWLGSANLTLPALRMPLLRGGNVELLIRAALDSDELRRLKADLAFWFSAERPAEDRETLDDSDLPRASGKVVAAELDRSGRSLRVETTMRTGTVALSPRPRATAVVLRIKNGKGVLKVPRGWAFADRVHAPGCWLIYERVDRRTFVPVLVNVPFVSAHAEHTGDALLDDVLDELWGKYRPTGDGEIDNDGEDGEEADPELERRLDEVRHQGELDRIAVKVALIKKRLREMRDSGYAERYRDHAKAQIIPRLRPNVASVVRAWLEEA